MRMFRVMSETKTVSATELVKNIRPWLDAVVIEDAQIIITRYGEPQAVLSRYASPPSSDSRPTNSAPSLGLPDQMGTVSAYTLEGEQR